MIGGGLAAGGSLGAAALQSSAAGNAAQTQAGAAEQAAQIQGQLGQESLQTEIQTQRQNETNQQPWLQTGANSLASLGYLLGVNPGGTVGSGSGGTPGQTMSIPGIKGSVTMPGTTPLSGSANTGLGAMGSLMQAYPGGAFTAPTAAEARQTPGYQFALNQGEGAVNAGAAANGSLLTGGTLNAEQQFGQGLADTNYNTTYNQALQGYNTNYNTWANNQANQFNRLAAMSGMGQTAAQTLGSQRLQSTGQIASTLNATGGEIGQNMMNAANATASGYINSANAWGGGLTNATGAMSNMLMMNQMMRKSPQQGKQLAPWSQILGSAEQQMQAPYGAQPPPPPNLTGMGSGAPNPYAGYM